MENLQAPTITDIVSTLITNRDDIVPAHGVLISYLVSRTCSTQTAAKEILAVSCSAGDEAEGLAVRIAECLVCAAIDEPVLRDRIAKLAQEINGYAYADDVPRDPATDLPQPAAKGAASHGFHDEFFQYSHGGVHFEDAFDAVRDRSSDTHEQASAAWHGLNSFLACYVASSRLYVRKRLEHVEYYTLDDAFTVLSRLEDHFGHPLGADECSPDADVPAAAAWFIKAGYVIYCACRDR